MRGAVERMEVAEVGVVKSCGEKRVRGEAWVWDGYGGRVEGMEVFRLWRGTEEIWFVVLSLKGFDCSGEVP